MLAKLVLGKRCRSVTALQVLTGPFSRNAMDNASKNAGDMIANLQLKYNRGRQAAITNELVDIITGASAL